jgi:hypothetical protein
LRREKCLYGFDDNQALMVSEDIGYGALLFVDLAAAIPTGGATLVAAPSLLDGLTEAVGYTYFDWNNGTPEHNANTWARGLVFGWATK